MVDKPGTPFRVVFSEALREQLRRLGQRADAQGITAALGADLRTIVEALAADPVSWGDPLNRLPHLRLTLYHRIYHSISVRYGVEEQERVVFVRECKPISGHPLCQD